MELIHQLGELAAPREPAIVTIGNFDGVHLAHRQLLESVVAGARTRGARAVAVTFDPHPIKLLAPDRVPKVLTPLEQKARLIEKLGIDVLVAFPFTKHLAHLAPAEFVRQVLVEGLAAAAVYVGPNFRFGYRQAGDVEALKALGRAEGFQVEVLPFVEIRGQRVSSTRIRELIAAGMVHSACRLLGRPFSNSGRIVAGLGYGHRHTVPTLNLSPVEEMHPRIGVYVSRTRLAGVAHDSVTNVGHKPTFGTHDLSIETYLLNFRGEVQESEMEIEYLFRLRDEIKFQNPAILKVQIEDDARRSLQYFRLVRRLQHSQKE